MKTGIQKGWWVTEHNGVELWHFKKSARSMTKLYTSQAEMISDNDKWDFYFNCRIPDLPRLPSLKKIRVDIKDSNGRWVEENGTTAR